MQSNTCTRQREGPSAAYLRRTSTLELHARSSGRAAADACVQAVSACSRRARLASAASACASASCCSVAATRPAASVASSAFRPFTRPSSLFSETSCSRRPAPHADTTQRTSRNGPV
eukprot:2034290-Pleurochrysis_carterae.AAC.3